MKKITSYILRQIWNERSSNIALFIEIFIVSIIVWFLTDIISGILLIYYEPTNCSTERCFQLQYEHLPESSPLWNEETDNTSASDMRRHFINELINLPEVEDVAVSDQLHDGNFYPYKTLYVPDDTARQTSVRAFACSANTPRVFAYQSVDGMTTEELSAVLERGEAIITEYLANLLGRDRAMGHHRLAIKRMNHDNDSVDIVVGAIIKVPKIDRWNENNVRSKACMVWTTRPVDGENLDDSNWYHSQIVVKAKPRQEQALEETLRQRMENCGMNYANYYLDDLKSYDTIRHNYSSGAHTYLRYLSLFLLFLLVNVFLGLLGTFWLRTQQRQSELGLQKALGARSSTLVWRLVFEAMLIMTIAFLLAVPVAYAILTNELTVSYYNEYFTPSRLLRSEVLSYLLMTVIILLGIAIPAWRTANTNPIDVLHDE